MKKKDILELKRRLKKDDCTFTRMCGCYVDGQKNIVLNIEENFLKLRDEEFFKYLEIAKKVLSGTVGNNLLELNFPDIEENEGGRQLSLMRLKKSCLKDEAMLYSFYKSVVDSLDYAGNFLILLFHDAYDVMIKTSDNLKLDESSEVYEYILCAICPVSLAKPALSYLEDENRIGARIRDWIVGPPELGFVFPAFIDRSTDIHSIIYYAKNAKEPHPELMEEVLGCSSKKTAAEQKEDFQAIIKKAAGSDEEKSDKLFMEIQETLNNVANDHTSVNGKNAEPIVLSDDNISDILTESGVDEEVQENIKKAYTDKFSESPFEIENLIDKKALKENEKRKKEEHLKKKVQILEEELEKTKNDEAENQGEKEANEALNEAASESEEHNNVSLNYDIILKVKPQKVSQIKSQVVDGKKCIVIPVEDNEQANVNGINTTF